MKNLYLLSFFTFISFFAKAQTEVVPEILADTIKNRFQITAGRMQLHLMIARKQNEADVTDGVYDRLIDRDANMDKTALISHSI